MPAGSPANALLKGKLFDDTGDHLTPTHTKKKGQVIRYYISNCLIHARDPTGWRLPAAEIEGAVLIAAKGHLQAKLQEDAAEIESYDALSGRLAQINNTALFDLIERGDLAASRLRVTLEPDACKDLFGPGCHCRSFDSALHLAKRGCGRKLILGACRPAPDATLVRTLARAHDWLTRIKSGEPLSAIARSEATSECFIRTRLLLALLSPKIQASIMKGLQPPDLTTAKFIKSRVPMDWIEQEALYLA